MLSLFKLQVEMQGVESACKPSLRDVKCVKNILTFLIEPLIYNSSASIHNQKLIPTKKNSLQEN